MIVNKNVTLTMNNRYVKHYQTLGYKVKGGDTIQVKIEDLTPSSNVILTVTCDCCGTDKLMGYNTYNRFTLNQTEPYYCHKCNDLKRKKTNQERYGCDNVFQSEEKKEKRRQTMIERHGSEHALRVPEFKAKTKATNQERFGYDYASQNEEIKQKIEDTFMRNYGVKTSLLDPETIEKIKETNTKLYGVDNVLKLREFKEEAMLRVYSVEYPGASEEIRERVKKTNNERFGCDCCLSNKEIQKKSKKTRLERGSYLTEEQRTTYKNYWLKVKRITVKNRKTLFETWDGTDYYDGEYIKENFALPSGSKEYPTLDHKISVSYGFKHDIDPEEIGKLENLCITKRSINSRKHSNCDYSTGPNSFLPM